MQPRIGGFPGNELVVRRIRDSNRQPQFGRREGQVFIKGREGRNPVIDGFGRGAGSGERIPVFLDFGNGHQEEARRFLGPDGSPVPDERQDSLFIRAAGVETAGPIHPAFKDRIDGRVKGFDADADFGSEGAVHWATIKQLTFNRRQARHGCG
jgi:hypothetical protein